PLVYVMSDDFAELNPKNVSQIDNSIRFNFLPAIGIAEIAFQELDRSDTDSAFNKIARRRMKWLSCNK
ncbi:MAG: hypothetical protein PHP35_01195, partial [Candidatus Colwellbacteria bacterium]|nr:hypothetical protein [Candidatus Colwellbacteria bacterium]